MTWLWSVLKALLGWLLAKPGALSQEAVQANEAGAATHDAIGAQNAVTELKQAAAAGDAAAAVQLRAEGTGVTTTDPGAAINQTDLADRRD